MQAPCAIAQKLAGCSPLYSYSESLGLAPDALITSSDAAITSFERTAKINILGPLHASDVVCPTAAEIAAVEDAIRRRDIGYHAFPFNAEPEVCSPELFDAALNLTFRLDDRLGHPHRQTLSQRDVPGLTRAAVPLLARRGVRAVSVGENSQVAPYAVPPIFVWRDEATETEVLALFHALGYGRQQQRGAQSSPISKSRAGDISCNCRDAGARGCACADDPGTLMYIDSNGDKIGKAELDPYDDGPGMHVTADGKVHANRWEHCVDVDAAGSVLQPFCFRSITQPLRPQALSLGGVGRR